MTTKKIKKAFSVALLCLLFQGVAYGDSYTYNVSADEIFGGYIVKKIWLENYAIPEVKVSDITYSGSIALPDGTLPSSPERFDVVLGKERKRPFVLVRVPAYTGDAVTLDVKRVTGFTLTVEEKAQPSKPQTAAKTTGGNNSVLANGSWYKISVPNTGLYKVDFAMLNSTGINAAAINPAHIRVYGNGGRMLPENNAIPRPAGLTENAIWVSDGGDGKFDPGDYFIFYAIGPTSWEADAANKRFNHKKNIYEDKSYYFLNFDQGAGARITMQQNPPQGNVTVNTVDAYALHEEDLHNPGKLGKEWYGEEFGTDPGKVDNHTIDMNLGPVSGNLDLRVVTASRAQAPGSAMNVLLNGQLIKQCQFGTAGTHPEDIPVDTVKVFQQVPFGGGNAQFKFTYQPAVSTARGYLDYIEINYRRPLAFTGSQIDFRDWNSVGTGNIATYQLSNANGQTQVWDVTDPYNPVRMSGTLNGNTYTFSQEATILHEFIALNSNQLPAPDFIGSVDNQNIHGAGPVDYVIVTHPNFKSAADKLADFHRQRSNMSVLVATTQQVYNEFSSGSQDISAIRDMMRMFYQEAADSNQMPRYLLLLGDASYDYKDRIPNNTNFVPTFESAQSMVPISSFCNDDFFGFLDDNENIENTTIPNTLDIGVGRMPVKTIDEANTMVNKVLHYKSPSSLGPWRLSATFVADNYWIGDNADPAGDHFGDGEVMSATVKNSADIYNNTKIYLDATPLISTPGGHRAPEANKAINDRIFKGTLMVNYSGHGNINVLAEERIVTQDDFNKWKNIDKMPFIITATCDFGRFDHPEYVSAGEKIALKGDGGAIATLTTTQLVYQYANRLLNQQYLEAQFNHVNGRWNTFGDAIRIGKNATYEHSTDAGTLINFRKFVLLGDPALEPNFPQYFIRTEALKDGNGNITDSVKALGEYQVEGSVTDVNNNVLTGFNGNLDVTFYDKPRTVTTLTKGKEKFQVQNNVIYKGKATVANGKFSFRFIAPKDINYDYGRGKVSYYAENGTTDGAGTDSSVTVGGFSDNPVIENNPPIVHPYINDSFFVDGGLTGSNTALFAILEDETGINISGNSVGHDLTAVLDDDVSNPYVMNDYYETAPNTYKRGYVYFPVTGLPEGRHRFTVKAWDVNNNSGEGHVNFEVVNGEVIKVQNLMNYPSPFRDVTHFVFEHNHPEEELKVEINVYNTTGALVRTIKETFTPTGSRSNEIMWDGTDNNGVKLTSGVYVYRMKLSTNRGIDAIAYQKLVIVR